MTYLFCFVVALVLFFVVVGAVQAAREGCLGEYIFNILLLSFLWDD